MLAGLRLAATSRWRPDGRMYERPAAQRREVTVNSTKLVNLWLFCTTKRPGQRPVAAEAVIHGERQEGLSSPLLLQRRTQLPLMSHVFLPLEAPSHEGRLGGNNPVILLARRRGNRKRGVEMGRSEQHLCRCESHRGEQPDHQLSDSALSGFSFALVPTANRAVRVHVALLAVHAAGGLSCFRTFPSSDGSDRGRSLCSCGREKDDLPLPGNNNAPPLI